jgi:hypothetical protein
MNARYCYRSIVASQLGPMLVGHPCIMMVTMNSHRWEIRVPDIDHSPDHGEQTVITFYVIECHSNTASQRFPESSGLQMARSTRHLAAGDTGYGLGPT